MLLEKKVFVSHLLVHRTVLSKALTTVCSEGAVGLYNRGDEHNATTSEYDEQPLISKFFTVYINYFGMCHYKIYEVMAKRRAASTSNIGVSNYHK